MVKEWGMSEKVGFRTIENSNSSLVVVNDLSPETSELIDSEIKRLLEVIMQLTHIQERLNETFLHIFLIIGIIQQSPDYLKRSPA